MGIEFLPSCDPEGFLRNRSDWSPPVAEQLAATDKLTLTEAHWEIIYFLQKFYEEYQHIPKMRGLVNALKKEFNADKMNSQYLYSLFPEGPIRQGCKIAGLPKPPHCM